MRGPINDPALITARFSEVDAIGEIWSASGNRYRKLPADPTRDYFASGNAHDETGKIVRFNPDTIVMVHPRDLITNSNRPIAPLRPTLSNEDLIFLSNTVED